MFGLLVFYLLIAGTACYERQWPVVLYWVSAAGILAALLWMR